MNITVHNKKYVCIDYPGIVENKDNMLESLGGLKFISKIYSEPSRRLELRLRPKDIYCKCSHGDRFNTTNLLMKVTRRRKKNSDPKDYVITKAEIMGTVEITYKFRSIMDYQYLPMQNNNNVYESLEPVLIMRGLQLSSWLQDENPAPVFVQPPLFSRFDQPSNYHFRREPQQRDPSRPPNDQHPPHIIGRNRKKRGGFAIFLNYEDTPAPAKCTDDSLKLLQQKKTELKFMNAIQKAFEERPVWSRNALGNMLGIDRSQFKFLLPTVAYYFITGPWRTFWVRFGYDPRLDPTAKHLQTLDVRIRIPPIPGINFHYKRSIQVYNLPNKTTTAQPRVGTIEKETFLQVNDEVEETQECSKRLCIFKPGQLPKHKQVFYQICDIEMPEVQELVNRNNGQEVACHEKEGWCLPGTLDKCRELILKDVRATIEKIKKEHKSSENAGDAELDENESDYEAEEMEEMMEYEEAGDT